MRSDSEGVIRSTGTETGVENGGVRGLDATGGVLFESAGCPLSPATTGIATPGDSAPDAGLVCGRRGSARSSPQRTLSPTAMIPPQTEQRARRLTLVILAGSSRKTERHSGHETFISPL
jgi:hypothetical protein